MDVAIADCTSYQSPREAREVGRADMNGKQGAVAKRLASHLREGVHGRDYALLILYMDYETNWNQ